MPTPTAQTYTELQQAYDYFNTALFGGQLPPCLITLQRRSRTYGYFSGDRWTDRQGAARTDEIAMNPAHFATRRVEDVLSTLAHEMAHLWQYHLGTPSRTGYHNKQWAAMMDTIGLCPSSTGQPGGKRTGQHMSHYIIDGGPFHKACRALLAQGVTISWLDRAGEDATTRKKANTRTKYTCPTCGLNAWAKPDIVLLCGECEIALVAEDGVFCPTPQEGVRPYTW
jgi:predicted SprT family Zn-dependent metalloprotease